MVHEGGEWNAHSRQHLEETFIVRDYDAWRLSREDRAGAAFKVPLPLLYPLLRLHGELLLLPRQGFA